MNFTTSEIHTYWTTAVPGIKPTGKHEMRAACPIHNGKGLNFSVNAGTGFAYCHSQCNRGWDILSFEMARSATDFARAKEHVHRIIGRPQVAPEDRNVEAVYTYVDSASQPVYEVVRMYGKQFRQRRRNPDGSYSWGLGGVKQLPFRADRIKNADTVFLVEGEKDVLTTEQLGLVASCNSGGAGNFRPELVPYFKNKDIIILLDNDQAGREHAQKIAELLAPVAKSVKIVELPGLPAKGDVTDFINAGGTVDQIRELYRKAPLWSLDFEFACEVPDENDKYVGTIEREVEAAGGLTGFWDFTKSVGLPTPFSKLNCVLGGGMRPGEMYVLAGNQGSGKTSMALQFAILPLRNNLGVLIFSMEMDRRAIFQRMAGIEARVDLHAFAQDQRKKADVAEEMSRLCRATATMAGWKLLASTKPRVTPEYITAETHRISKRSKVDLVIVDHMQLMGADTNTRGNYEKVTAISRALKITAAEVGVPLLVLSQTSRSNSRDKRDELEVSDLRDSGAIEEDAAGVFLLFEDRADAEAAKTDTKDGRKTRYMTGPVKTLLKIGKNRYGLQGAYVMLNHLKSETRFEQVEREERENE